MHSRRRRVAASLRPSRAYNVLTTRVFHQGTVQLRVCRVQRTGSRRRTERACFALAFERCSKPCFGPSEGVGGALAPAGGPNVRGCQPLSAAPGVTPGAPSPAAAPKKGTRMHVRTRAASLQLYCTARVYWENSAPQVSTSGSCLVNGSESLAAWINGSSRPGSRPYTDRLTPQGIFFPRTTVASWCETCVFNDGTVDPMSWDTLAVDNVTAMG
eukprot:COSAG06_NODE_10712_length_1630_cov_112.784455_2_plen_214_part_00